MKKKIRKWVVDTFSDPWTVGTLILGLFGLLGYTLGCLSCLF